MIIRVTNYHNVISCYSYEIQVSLHMHFFSKPTSSHTHPRFLPVPTLSRPSVAPRPYPLSPLGSSPSLPSLHPRVFPVPTLSPPSSPPSPYPISPLGSSPPPLSLVLAPTASTPSHANNTRLYSYYVV